MPKYLLSVSRRRLVSNVAKDMRTPLTLHDYRGALLPNPSAPDIAPFGILASLVVGVSSEVLGIVGVHHSSNV